MEFSELFIINFAKPAVSGLASIINWLIGISSSIALGVILFTIILKLITFPFDMYSRMSMRKNSILMENMREDLEKLQKQYANDKALYNQKMMALYKKNGYSMWGSCLPTILTLVIFIVAISAFTSYSQFQNRQYFYDMSLSYNQQIYENIKGEDSIDGFSIVDGKLIIDESKFTKQDDKIIITTTNGKVEWKVGGDCLSAKYFIVKDKYDSVINDCREASADTFRQQNASFLWVKNIFMPDSALEHPIYEDWEKFQSNFSYSNIIEGQTQQANMSKETYQELIYNLNNEKEAPNGYFILVILTAGISFLSQFIMNKANKAQMELQTVDGQGAQTQKMMSIIMPIMMAIFAFMYTAAFSIYIVLSSVIGILTTLLINFIADKKYKNLVAEKKPTEIRGRVYIPKEEPKKQPEKKKNKKQKVNEHDFLSGLADKKKK